MKGKRKTKGKAIIFIILLTLLFTACSYTPPNMVEKSEPIEQENYGPPKIGGRLNIATTRVLSLDPFKANDDEVKEILSFIYDGLVKVDWQGMIQPGLAESWELDDSGKVYTLKLRNNVKWHNGETFSSSDVKANFDRMREIKRLRLKEYEQGFPEFNNIQNYEAPDEDTFIIYLYEPDRNFLYQMNRGILPLSYFEALKTKKTNEQVIPEFVGTGPFKIVEETGESIKLKRNDMYFDKKPYIEEININLYLDYTSMMDAFNNGHVDLIQVEAGDWNIFNDMEDTYILEYPSRYFEFIAVNLRNPILSDKNVRQAILLGIDRNRILQDTVLGRGLVIDGPVLPYSWAFNSQIQHVTRNKQMAIQLLEDAQWVDEKDDGILRKTIDNKEQKLEFELLVNVDNGSRYKVATFIEKELKDIGVSVKIVNMPWEELKTKVMSKNYDAAIMGWELAANTDLGFMFASSEIKNGYNFVSYSNPEFDEVLTLAQRDEKRQVELLYKAQEIISQDLPYLFLYSPNKLLAIREKIRDVKPDSVNLFNNISDWWIDE